MQQISAADLCRLYQQDPGLCIVDVRTPAEYASLHLPGSHNLPLGQVQAADLARVAGERDTVYLMCRTQRRSGMVAEAVAGELHCKLVIVEGGITAMPESVLQKGERNVIPLERQVRIAAGLLVLAGVLAGFAVAPGFFVLSGVVGAGLVFSGVTDTCPMAMLIARMPWNRA